MDGKEEGKQAGQREKKDSCNYIYINICHL